MRKGKNRVCINCGKLIRPGGMGGHVRLAHGITVMNVRDIRGDVPADVRDVRVQHPSDYVPKRAVVETKVISVSVHQTPIVLEEVSFVRYCSCCGGNMKLFEKKFGKASLSHDALWVICNECLKKYKKEDVHEETKYGTLGLWWYIPDSRNQSLRIDKHFTENRILLSEFLKYSS